MIAAATPLLGPAQMGVGVYGKLELVHPSGSIKHRSIPPLLEQMRQSGELSKGQPVIVHSAGSAAITTAWAGARAGHPVHAMLPSATAPGVLRTLRWLGARCHLVRSREVRERIAALREESGAVFLDQANDARMVEHYEGLAEELLEQLPGLEAVVTGVGTGASITGVARGLRRRGSSSEVIGVEPAECRLSTGQPWAPHRIAGLAPPFPQVLLEPKLLGGVLPIASERAWEAARAFARSTGWMIGPAAGAALAGALLVREDRGLERVVALLTGSLHPLLGSEPELP